MSHYGGGYGGAKDYGSADQDRENYPDPFSSPHDVEMHPYSRGSKEYGAGGGPFSSSHHPTGDDYILDECQEIQTAIHALHNRLSDLITTHRALVVEGGSSGSSARERFESTNKDLMASVKQIVARVRAVKSQPGATAPRNSSQVALVDTMIREFITNYRQEEERMHHELEAQQVRQYKIAVPEASDEEAREVVRTGNDGVFKQAFLQSDRRGQAQSALTEAEHRRKQMASILDQIRILSNLFSDLDTMVVEQGAMVEAVGAQVVETKETITQANVVMEQAVETAVARNRKKRWCLLIAVLIVLIVGAIVGVVVAVNKGLFK